MSSILRESNLDPLRQQSVGTDSKTLGTDGGRSPQSAIYCSNSALYCSSRWRDCSRGMSYAKSSSWRVSMRPPPTSCSTLWWPSDRLTGTTRNVWRASRALASRLAEWKILVAFMIGSMMSSSEVSGPTTFARAALIAAVWSDVTRCIEFFTRCNPAGGR